MKKERRGKKPHTQPKPWVRDAFSVLRQGWLPYSFKPVNIIWLRSVGRSGPGCLHLLLEITGCHNSLSSAARSADTPAEGSLHGLERETPASEGTSRPGPAAAPVTAGQAGGLRGCTVCMVPPRTRWKTASQRGFRHPQNQRKEKESPPPSFSAGCFGVTR